MDEDTLKYLPNSLMTGQFILLKRSTGGKTRPSLPLCDNCEATLKKDKSVTICKTCQQARKQYDIDFPPGEPWRQVVEVFDQGGTWIGQISNPEWIPKSG